MCLLLIVDYELLTLCLQFLVLMLSISALMFVIGHYISGFTLITVFGEYYYFLTEDGVNKQNVHNVVKC